MQNFTNFTKIIPVNDKLLCLNCRMFRISNLHSRKTKHLGTNLPSMTYRQMSWRGDVWVNVVIFNHWNRCSPWCSPNKCYKTDRSPDDSRCLYNVIYLRLLPQLPRPCVVERGRHESARCLSAPSPLPLIDTLWTVLFFMRQKAKGPKFL